MEHHTFSPLYPIVNIESHRDALPFIHKLLDAGSDLLQIRAKSMTDDSLAHIVRAAVEAAGTRAKIIVNDRIDVALECRAAGVHLGQDDDSVFKAREILGARALIGLSTHNIAQVENANKHEIDYIGFGPIFSSPTKSGHAPEVGATILRRAAALSRHPVVAIGGITFDNAQELLASGCAAVAVISELERTSDLQALVGRYQRV